MAILPCDDCKRIITQMRSCILEDSDLLSVIPSQLFIDLMDEARRRAEQNPAGENSFAELKKLLDARKAGFVKLLKNAIEEAVEAALNSPGAEESAAFPLRDYLAGRFSECEQRARATVDEKCKNRDPSKPRHKCPPTPVERSK